MTNQEKALLRELCRSVVSKEMLLEAMRIRSLTCCKSTINKYWRIFHCKDLLNKDKKIYICISIKHSMHNTGWWLWSPNFSGYTGDVSRAGIYSPDDFKAVGYPVVKMCKNLCSIYKKYDSVLVEKDDFISYNNDLTNCQITKDIDEIKAILHGLECILTSKTIEPAIRIEKAIARIRDIRGSN